VGRLFDRIVFALPAADPPLLMQALSADALQESKIWVVRDPSALRVVADPQVRRLASVELGALLGMTGRPVLMIASIQVDAAPVTASAPAPTSRPSAPVLIWVVRYPDEAQARAAYRRYEAAAAEGRTDLARATRLIEPVGPYLAGTWTAEHPRSLAILDAIRELLPYATQTHPALATSRPGDE